MRTERNAESFLFQALGRREIVARFDGGTITSDAGAVLLREMERITGIVRPFVACFTDPRGPHRTPARKFKDFTYSTLDSWSCERRVVGEGEHLERGTDPRLVVPLLPPEHIEAKSPYEDVYCARGDMENRINEQQLCVFADRTSSTAIRAKELRLCFSSLAYTLMTALQQLGLQGTELAPTQCGTIRLKLLKVGDGRFRSRFRLGRSAATSHV
jgi:hypothetical protein